ncbi:hypothetical protein NDU88_007785 [Pleurodeles waltl]|uniref:Uncharacterized protein n=1 Tax=Pleurodeles waltl TaxID=8319 RepID=A0AAV7VQP8_PLEWA|nr:hypothetical protein NDU88_007785 [Pleurodeles waltl]
MGKVAPGYEWAEVSTRTSGVAGSYVTLLCSLEKNDGEKVVEVYAEGDYGVFPALDGCIYHLQVFSGHGDRFVQKLVIGMQVAVLGNDQLKIDSSIECYDIVQSGYLSTTDL